MSAPALDERKHVDVITAALTAQLGANRVYEYGEIPGEDDNPGPLPPIFAVPAVERRPAPADRGGRQGCSGWRVSVRFAGRSASEARWAGLRVSDALNSVVLMIDGHKSTPVSFESQQAVAPGGGRHSGHSIWTYAL